MIQLQPIVPITGKLDYIGHCTECGRACYFSFSRENKPTIYETCSCNAVLAKGHPLFVTPMWMLRLLLMFVFSIAYYYTKDICILTMPVIIIAAQFIWYGNDRYPELSSYDIKRKTVLNLPATFDDEIVREN